MLFRCDLTRPSHVCAVQCFQVLEQEVPTLQMRFTVKAIIVTFFVGWNLHTLFSSVGPECLGWLGVQQTEICACFSDLVAKCLYCTLATLLRVQV